MKHLSGNEIRKMWLDFFKSKGHRVEAGSSLIPHNDPTLLWINSGVAALKKYFDGSEVPPSRRITNAQRSIRTNDIENVGHTARHHTFFEMLGNFSIGDYFRKEVIAFATEILTSEQYFAFDKDKLYMTYHPSDLETKKYWMENGIEESHLIPLEHNFWQIGEGPCGPNTEVFYDRGTKYDPENIGIRLLSEEMENDRYIEIWGIVFSQYNAVEGVKREDYKELPSKNIDTGAGLERIACIMQEKETNFETDLFWPIIEAVEKMSNHKYHDNELAFRVIADHIRACTFALADGEMFSNEGRGYVLRRLLRRAERFGRVLGIEKPFLYQLVGVVIDIMKSFYSYLIAKQSFIEKMIKAEEEKFIKTLSVGEALLRKTVQETGELSGKDFFKLYDTFGFPKELTMEICDEMHVPYDLEGFNAEMKLQKERARNARNAAQSMKKQSKDLLDFKAESEFTYGSKPIEAKVVGLFVDGVKVDTLTTSGEVVFDKTIFYAESGGQVADQGEIKNEECEAKVVAVEKAPNKQHLHSVEIYFGEIKVGDTFTLSIDERRRERIRRNHSSVHLLQAALTEVLGDHISQHGSYVDDEKSTFDFSHYQKMSDEEIKLVEEKVNQWIDASIPGEVKVLPIEEAKKLGAKALFNDKYGDVVRVVCFGDVSKEFCGGTHVSNTQDIGFFKIEFEESVASGVRRIQARTSYGAYELIKRQDALLKQTRGLLDASSDSEINTRIRTLVTEKDNFKKQNDSLSKKVANAMSASLEKEMEQYDGLNLLVASLENTKRDALVSTSDSLKSKYNDYIIILVGDDENTIPLYVACSKSANDKGYLAGKIVKNIATYLEGSGGGRPDSASGAGKNKAKISSLLKEVKGLLK